MKRECETQKETEAGRERDLEMHSQAEMDSQTVSHMERQRRVTIDTGRGKEDRVREIEKAIVSEKEERMRRG